MSDLRVRFAPSPTGHLHIGGLRTALFNYLFARKHKGSYLLRIEDTDLVRSNDDYKQSIIDSFNWVGLLPDEPLVIQSTRFNEHMAIVEQLLKEGKAYRCYCSSDDIDQRVGKKDGEFIRYDRHCLKHKNTFDAASKSHVIRFVMPEVDHEVYQFNDLIRGSIVFEPQLFDDFIIVRSDGIPVYNFVVVIDDAWMKITHVIRGEEHIPNTPKQIALYKACGYRVPQFAHLPMILGPGGHKLSKRDGAKSTYEYKQEGYLPEALINYLVRLGWSHGDQELFTKAELEQFFDLDYVQKKGAVFDQAKLDWINAHYLKRMTPSQICAYLIKELSYDVSAVASEYTLEQIHAMVALAQVRAITLRDIIAFIERLVSGPKAVEVRMEYEELFHKLEVVLAMREIENTLKDGLFSKEIIKSIVQKTACSMPDCMHGLRIALIGLPAGPSIDEMVRIIGYQRALARIQSIIE